MSTTTKALRDIVQRRATQKKFREDAFSTIEQYGWTYFALAGEHGREYFKLTPLGEFRAFVLYSENDLFSVYLRAMMQERAAPVVNESFIDKMNPYSGKWNIHEHSPERALNELKLRLKYLNATHS